MPADPEERKRRYREKHIAAGLCVKCPRPVWQGRRTCYKHTMHLRMVAQRPKSKAKRLARLKLRNRCGEYKKYNLYEKQKAYKAKKRLMAPADKLAPNLERLEDEKFKKFSRLLGY